MPTLKDILATPEDWWAALSLTHHHYYVGAAVFIGLFFVGTSFSLAMKAALGIGVYLLFFLGYFLFRMVEFRDSFVGQDERLQEFKSMGAAQRRQFLKEFLRS